MVSVEDVSQASLQCPHCGELFSISSEAFAESAPPDGVEDAQARAEMEARREADLSELRIRQVVGLRRGAYRSRAYLIIGLFICAVGFVLFPVLAVRDWRLGLRLGPLTDLILAAGAIVLFQQLLRRLPNLNREIRESKMSDPEAPPDLSTLSDGSQWWANLDELANRTEER
jgi:hypothetical protein